MVMRRQLLIFLIAIMVMLCSVVSYAIDTSIDYINTATNTCSSAEDYAFCDNEEIKYYAYMDISAAEEEIIPIILQARNIIIYSHSWVADGIHGYTTAVDGSKTPLPQFHDLFPEDWEEPCF